jgi:raffinose/stachyose/melibiose transport system permease protein
MAVTIPSVSSATRSASKERSQAAVKQPRKRIDPIFYWYLVPTIILFTVAITLPALVGIAFSFTNYAGFGSFKFVGITNYLSLASDPAILASYGFTIFFAVVTVIVTNVIALSLAIGLTTHIKFKTTLRAIFVIPMVISGIVIAYVFSFLFSNSLPALATSLGFGPLESSILANPDLAWIAIVIVAAWQAAPGAILIYLAGLLSIPGEVYEAASMDGASTWQRFRSVTFPLIFGYVVINTILGFKGFLNVYDIIVGLTNGGPGTATTSVAMNIFAGLDTGEYSYQMANATVFFIVTVIVALIQLRLTRGKGFTL